MEPDFRFWNHFQIRAVCLSTRTLACLSIRFGSRTLEPDFGSGLSTLEPDFGSRLLVWTLKPDLINSEAALVRSSTSGSMRCTWCCLLVTMAAASPYWSKYRPDADVVVNHRADDRNHVGTRSDSGVLQLFLAMPFFIHVSM